MPNNIGGIRDPALFQRLVRSLYAAEYGHDFQVVDDSSGDRGNDGYDPHLGRMLAIYCPVKEETRKRLLKKARSDLGKAVRLKDDPAYQFDKWFFLTPRALPEGVQAVLRAEAASAGLEATFLSAEHLEPMYLKHSHLRDLFPELTYPEVQRQIESVNAKLGSVLAQSGALTPHAPNVVQVLVEGAVAGHLAELTDAVSNTALRELAQMRENWREGRHSQVWDWLSQYEAAAPGPKVLPAVTFAEVLRFRAGLLLEDVRNIEEAAELMDKARQLHPSGNDLRLRAVLALRRGNGDDALAILDSNSHREPSEQNLRAGVLLELGRPTEALDALSSMTSWQFTGPDAVTQERVVTTEAHRLRAVAHFVLHDIGAAQSEITIASSHSPAWDSVRYLDAVIKYHRGLSALAHPRQVPSSPPLVDPVLVGRDTSSQESIRSALGIFDRLLEIARDNEDRRRLEGWRLACLANLSAEGAQATRYASELLRKDLENEYAVLWVAHRGIPLDLGPNLDALSARGLRNRSTEDIVIVVNAYLAIEQGQQASRLLDEARSMFVERAEDIQWRYWRAQAAVTAGDEPLAESLSADLPPAPRSALRATALQVRAAKERDSTELIAHLEEMAHETGNPRYTLEVCKLHARNGSWAYVAERAAGLLSEIDTLETRRLVALAYLHALQFDRCRDVASSTLEQLSDKALAAEFLRIRAQALIGMGRISNAIEDLETLTATNPETQDLLELARMHALQGDLHRVAVLAAGLRDRADLSPVSSLGLAEIVIHVDRDLARALWRLAAAKPLPDHAVGRALVMGMQLGLDSETVDLTAHMTALASAGRGGVQAFSISELLKMADEWRDHHAKVVSLYYRGEAPIHALSAALNRPMTLLFHPSDLVQDDVLNRFAPRVRFGGRPLPAGDLGIGPGRLCLDVTALLLSQQLGILDLVERSFGPLYLPFGIMRFFLEEREKLGPPQPSRVETDKIILEAERKGLVSPRPGELPTLAPEQTRAAGPWAQWLALLELARQEQAFVLDFALEAEAEHGRPLAEASAEQLQRLVTPRQVVEALTNGGRLTATDRERTLQALGNTASFSAVQRARDAPPPLGATLHTLRGSLDALADAGLLAQMAECFKLVVEPKEQDERRATVAGIAELGRTQEWLDSLMRRVSDGLTHGVYRQLPQPIERRPQGASTAIDLLGQLVSPHEDLIDAVWVDDRFVNQFSFSGRARVVDILEVLAALEARGAIDGHRRVDLILRLREANARFIPPSADELLQHVKAATLSGGNLLETRALALVRRSLAAALADRSSLRLPKAPPTAPVDLGELPYLLTVYHAVVDAITALWRGARDEAGDPESIARVTEGRVRWIVDNVMLDIGLVRAALLHPDSPPDPQVSAAGLAALVAYAVTLLDRASNGTGEPEDEWAKRYLHWLWRSVIEPRVALDPALRTALVAQVGKHLIGLPTERGDDPAVMAVVRLLAGRQFDAMPAELQAELSKDKELLDFVGREISDVFGDGQHSFPADSFVGAVAGALRGEVVRIKDVGGNEFLVEPAPPPGVFLIREPRAEPASVVGDPAYYVLSDDVQARLEAVTRLRWDLDLTPEAEEEFRVALAVQSNARTRLQMLEKRLSRSLRRRYRLLEKELYASGKFDLAAIAPPSVPDMLAYLRFPSLSDGTALADALDRAAACLIEQVGVEEAFQRVSGLPVELPGPVLAHLSSMESGARRKLIGRALRRPTSPIGFLHALRVLAHLAATDRTSSRLLRRLARRIGSERWNDEVEVFKALLSNSLEGLEEEAHGDLESRALLISAWVHAHETAIAFFTARADPAKLGDLLARLHTRRWIHLFTHNPPARHDVSHPRRINAKRLALDGAAYALGDASDDVWTEELRSHLLSVLTTAAGERRLPVRELLLDTGALTNDLGSFLAPGDAESASGVSRFLAAVFAEFPDKRQVVSDALAKLLQNSLDSASWLTLYLVSGDVPLEGEASSKAIALTRNLNLAAVVPEVGQYAPLLITVVCNRTAISGDLADRERVIRQLIAVAATASAKAPVHNADATGTPGTPELIAGAVMEGCLVLSREQPAPEDAVKMFARALADLAESAPAWWPRFRPVVESLVAGLPGDLAHWLTPLLITARAAAPTEYPSQGATEPETR